MINEQTVKLKVASTSVEYARWGEITGNIESQTDLMNLLGERDLDDVQEAITQGLDDIDTAKEEAIEEIGQRGGITEAVKQALLNCFSHVAWIDDQGQTYYDALEDALYPPASLVSISAVYTQSGTVYDTDTLDSLKSDLVVTALWDNQTTTTVTDYTLSGTLTEGTSTITVAYGGKTTTFDVTVSAVPTLASISAVYTQSGTVYTTDTLDSLKSDLVVTATYSDSSTETVPSADYTLSGTLAEGTSTITVTYEGLTATFNVAVSALPWDLEWSYADGGLPFNVDPDNWAKGQATQTTSFVANEGIRFNGTDGIFSTYPKNDETSASSEFEIVCYFNTIPTVNGVIIRLGNGTIGMQTTIGNGGISIDNGVSQISGISISTGVNYTVKATCNTAGTCHLYLDGTEIWSGSPSAIGNKKNYVMMTSTSQMDAYIRSIKFRA